MTVIHLAVKHFWLISYYARIYMGCPRGVAVFNRQSCSTLLHMRASDYVGDSHQVKTHPRVLWPLSGPGKEIHGATMSKHNGRESDPAVAETLDRTVELFTLLYRARSNLLCTLQPIRCHQQCGHILKSQCVNKHDDTRTRQKDVRNVFYLWHNTHGLSHSMWEVTHVSAVISSKIQRFLSRFVTIWFLSQPIRSSCRGRLKIRKKAPSHSSISTQ